MTEKTVAFDEAIWQRGFTAMPNEILLNPDLSPGAVRTWALLAFFSWQKEECWVGQERLAKGCGVDRKTLRRYLDELKQAGLLRTQERDGQTNLYRLTTPRRTTGESTQVSPKGGHTSADFTQVGKANRPTNKSSSIRELHKEEFEEWIKAHADATGLREPRLGTKVRERVEKAFGDRMEEGYTLTEALAVIRGSLADEWRVERGYHYADSLLRPANFDKLLNQSERKQPLKRGERHHRAIETETGKCAKCGTEITAHQRNNQSRMCDDCYEKFEEGLT